MNNIQISPIKAEDYSDLILMAGDLFNEIIIKTNVQAVSFDPEKALIRAKDLISNEKYWVFMAKDIVSGKNIGFISLYESFALYTDGAFGTIPELFITQRYRSNKIGKALMNEVIKFAKGKSWTRLEVTTPPLPQFDKTLNFYQINGFEITGGRKLKREIKHTTKR